MKKNVFFFAAIVCICVSLTMSIQFDINNAKYKRGSDFWTVNIPVNGITGSYVIAYESLPAGWKTQGNGLVIPSAVTTFEGNYPLKCSVKTDTGLVQRRTLFFKFSGSGLFLGDYPYDYNFQATSASSSSSSTSSSDSSSSGSYVKSSEALSTSIVNTKILRSEYDVLPSLSDLDKIIDTADIVLITKTIQSVMQSNLNCLAKMGYLSDFLGKIESYISIKRFRAKDLNDIITLATKQIASLQLRITDYQKQITGLAIPALKIQLNKSLAKLTLAYSDFNTGNIDVSPFQLKITTYSTQLTSVNVEITKATTQIKSDQVQVAKLDVFIAELEDKLAKAKIQRANFLKRIAQSQDFLTKSLARVQQLQKMSAQIDLKIKNILADKDKLQQASASLEREVDQIKSKISLSEKRQAEVIGKLTELKIQISAQQLKLDRNQLDNINEMISLLESQVLEVRQRIDQLDLKCNGVIDIKVQVLDTQDILYTFNKTQFESYFNGFYGINAYSTFVSRNVQPSVSLYGYNIFSDKWGTTYGKPYLSDIKDAYSTGLITDYSFDSDFQCSNYQNLVNLNGKISSINGNTILAVDGTGKIYELQLGACSRINGINQYYPTLTNQISWRGVQNSGNKYFVHTATCY